MRASDGILKATVLRSRRLCSTCIPVWLWIAHDWQFFYAIEPGSFLLLLVEERWQSSLGTQHLNVERRRGRMSVKFLVYAFSPLSASGAPLVLVIPSKTLWALANGPASSFSFSWLLGPDPLSALKGLRRGSKP